MAFVRIVICVFSLKLQQVRICTEHFEGVGHHTLWWHFACPGSVAAHTFKEACSVQNWVDWNAELDGLEHLFPVTPIQWSMSSTFDLLPWMMVCQVRVYRILSCSLCAITSWLG